MLYIVVPCVFTLYSDVFYYAFLQVQILIQQAKARGKVMLVVEAHSATSSVSKQIPSTPSAPDTHRKRGLHLSDSVEKKSERISLP